MRRRAFLLTAGSVAAATAGVSGGATAAESGTTHTVEMTDQLAFEPDSLTVAPGDTVVFENVGNAGHSVTAYGERIPEDADYWASGGFDSEQAAKNGYEFEGGIGSGNVGGSESWKHAFETEGTHEYFCIPHESGGMVGQIEVSTGPASGDGNGSPPIGVPGLIFGGFGIGVASFLSGMYYGGNRNGEKRNTAALAGIGVVALAVIFLIAVVANLLVTG
jgi:plastocyanin